MIASVKPCVSTNQDLSTLLWALDGDVPRVGLDRISLKI